MTDPIQGPIFISIDEILLLHRLAIEDSRGDAPLRDRGLLESALAMPKQKFGEEYLHENIPAMAAAYAYHLCRNHPFEDGNRRIALAASI